MRIYTHLHSHICTHLSFLLLFIIWIKAFQFTSRLLPIGGVDHLLSLWPSGLRIIGFCTTLFSHLVWPKPLYETCGRSVLISSISVSWLPRVELQSDWGCFPYGEHSVFQLCIPTFVCLLCYLFTFLRVLAEGSLRKVIHFVPKLPKWMRSVLVSLSENRLKPKVSPVTILIRIPSHGQDIK